jgi:hypothetical protein
MKRCKKPKITCVLKNGHRPTCIAAAGLTIEIKGTPPEWPQEARFFYPDNQPFLVVFMNPAFEYVAGNHQDKGDRALYWVTSVAGWQKRKN